MKALLALENGFTLEGESFTGEFETGGEVIFNGKAVTDHDIDHVRQKMGMVFQHFNLFPHMTILRNMTLAPVKLLHKSQEEADAQALKLLQRVGLGDRGNGGRRNCPYRRIAGYADRYGNESRTAHGSTCQSKTMKLLCILQQGDLSVTDGSVLSHRLYFDFANRIGIDGKDGEDGTDGTDGLTPEIGKDGNWWIGDRNTGVPAVAFRSYASLAAFPKQGNNDMLYLDETTNRFYRWDAPAQNYRTVSPDYNDIKIIDGGNAQF